jgi:hypothetical protein
MKVSVSTAGLHGFNEISKNSATDSPAISR